MPRGTRLAADSASRSNDAWAFKIATFNAASARRDEARVSAM
jgi:hypothetical protein